MKRKKPPRTEFPRTTGKSPATTTLIIRPHYSTRVRIVNAAAAARGGHLHCREEKNPLPACLYPGKIPGQDDRVLGKLAKPLGAEHFKAAVRVVGWN